MEQSGKIKRIIKRAARDYGNPFVYTNDLWGSISQQSRNKLEDRFYPRELSNILQIYTYSKNLKLAIEIFENHHDDIRDIWKKSYNNNPKEFINRIKKEQVIEEQKLRGWIPQKEFKGFNPDYGHIFSNHTNLMVPLNIPRTIDQVNRWRRHYKVDIPIKWFFFDQYAIPGSRFENQ